MKTIGIVMAACLLLLGGCIGTNPRIAVTATENCTLLTATGILVPLPTTNVSYGIVLSANRQWSFFYANISNTPSATNHLGRPMHITVKLNPEVDVVNSNVSVRVKRVDVMRVEPER